MSDLHGEIMNIPCDPSRAPVAGVNAELAYKYGHRDARHAAAELAAAHGAERAQPAEAEGVVEMGTDAWMALHLLDRMDTSADEEPRVGQVEEIVRRMGAALSAVTAERDAANSRLHEVAVACATAEQERDQLRAEVERLRNELAGKPLVC